MKRASEILLYLFGAVSLFGGFIYGHDIIIILAEALLLFSIVTGTTNPFTSLAATMVTVVGYAAFVNGNNMGYQSAEVALLCFPALNGEWKSYKTIIAQGFLFGGIIELLDMKAHLNDAGLRASDYVYTLAWVIPTIIRCLEKYAKDKQTTIWKICKQYFRN